MIAKEDLTCVKESGIATTDSTISLQRTFNSFCCSRPKFLLDLNRFNFNFDIEDLLSMINFMVFRSIFLRESGNSGTSIPRSRLL